MNIIKAVMPKEERFFDLFSRHADTIVSAADAMVRLFAGERPIGDSCREIGTLEDAADQVAGEVLLGVRRSFITPFDRSAITGLISSMDNAVDEIWQTAKAITRFEVESFEPQMLEISRIAAEAARLVAEAVPLLRNIGRNGERLHQITGRIIELEERSDDLHEEGIKGLFQRHRVGDTMAFIVGRDVYGHLERVVDRLEDVAGEIRGIVIDHA